MPQNLWTSTDSTVYSVPGNWSLNHKPEAGDDVVLREGTADILSGFDADGQAFGVRSFHRHPLYTGNVGTSGAPLVLTTQAQDANQSPFSSKGKVIVQGPGEFYYSNNSWGATAALYVDTDTQDTAIELNGAIDALYCLKGRIICLSGIALGFLDIGWRTNPATDVHCTMQSTVEVWSFNQSGGELINTGTVAIVNGRISSGLFDHGPNGGTISTLIQSGGTVIHRSAAITSNLSILAGVCDYSQDPRAKTVSQLRVHPGAVWKQNANITITRGGTIEPITDIAPGRSV